MPQVAPGEPKRLSARIACKRVVVPRRGEGLNFFVAPPTAASHNKEVCRGLPAGAVARRETASRQTLPRDATVRYARDSGDAMMHFRVQRKAFSWRSGSSESSERERRARRPRVIITISLGDRGGLVASHHQ
jgi:hypothetical protein